MLASYLPTSYYIWDLTVQEASRYYCDLYWDVGKTNIPESSDDAQLTSPHLVPLAPVEGGK